MFRATRPRQTGQVKGSLRVLCSSIALPDGDVPEWLHLLPAGEVRTVDGRGPYRVADAAALMSASLAGGKLPLDENHATDLATPKGGAAPARGCIAELAQRDDGIWGRVEWTGTGRRMMEDREYRGVSPVIVHDKGLTIGAILRASLTNTPNLAGLVALHSQENVMDSRAWLIEALGLDADVADDAIKAVMTKAMEGKGARALLEAADWHLWVYLRGRSEHPRHEHLNVFNGLVLPPGYPFWARFYPPSDWGCSCYVLGARSARGARRVTDIDRLLIAASPYESVYPAAQRTALARMRR